MSLLNVRKDDCQLDFLSLGALIHRLDPGVVPFRKARSVEIHVSGGEYNVAAGLSDCFGLNTGIARAMVDYGIGELVETRVREMGVKPIFKRFEHNGVSCQETWCYYFFRPELPTQVVGAYWWPGAGAKYIS